MLVQKQHVQICNHFHAVLCFRPSHDAIQQAALGGHGSRASGLPRDELESEFGGTAVHPGVAAHRDTRLVLSSYSLFFLVVFSFSRGVEV